MFLGDATEPTTLRDEKTHLCKIRENLYKCHWGWKKKKKASRVPDDRKFWPERPREPWQLNVTGNPGKSPRAEDVSGKRAEGQRRAGFPRGGTPACCPRGVQNAAPLRPVRCTGRRAVSTGLRAGRLGPKAPASQFGCNSHVIPT